LHAHSNYWEDEKVCKSIAKEIFDLYDQDVKTDASKSLPNNFFADMYHVPQGPASTAGLLDYEVNFDDIDFKDLIAHATEIDVLTIYSRTWYTTNHHALVQALKRPGVSMRACLLSPESPGVEGLWRQFKDLKKKEALIERIKESQGLIVNAVQEARRDSVDGGRLRVFHSMNIINYSFYRFDNLVIFIPRAISGPKNAAMPIPASVFRIGQKNEGFADWLMKDFEALLERHEDAELAYEWPTVVPSANCAN
jgi:hypothetical protein